MKILVVEDDENSRVLQHTILEAGGHSVVSAANGREALVKISEGAPELIISDIMMPEMDGYALCRAVKSNPDLVHIPFVFYSATFTSSGDQQLAAELGGSRFLIKPMDPDAFLASIRELLLDGIPPEVPPIIQPLDKDAMDVKYANTISRKLDKKVEELKHAHSQLALTQTRLQQIKDSYRLAQKIAQVGCWDFNVSAREFWWSDELYALLGLAVGDKAPTRAMLLNRIAPEDRDRFERALVMAEEKAIPFHMDHHVIGPNDQLKLVRTETEITAFNPGTGRPARLVSVMQDITRQRQMEEDKARLELNLRQGQKIQALGSLASSIAHDFNNILTTIQANAEVLTMSDTALSAEDREQLDHITSACRRASGLVQQIMTFSRQEKQQKEPTLIATLVEEVLRLIKSSVPDNIKICRKFSSNCPHALANPTQIHQVVMNLCINAIHAIRPNAGQIDIQLDAIQVVGWDKVALEGLKAGNYVRLIISDNGLGMEEAIRDRIFEPYFTTKQPGEGTGLGLSVVHGIILEHHGQISVSSTPGQGTSFSIYLPTA